jgi:hypothetical protein
MVMVPPIDQLAHLFLEILVIKELHYVPEECCEVERSPDLLIHLTG